MYVRRLFLLHTGVHIKKTFTINEKNKDLGLLKIVRKQERLSLETRHEYSISVQGMTFYFCAWFYIPKSLHYW